MKWCDGEVMKVIHQIISSKSTGSSCFFVGSYRSNEVSPDHAVFHLMENLASSKVATQKLLLDGVKVEDLNTLIPDSLCTFPRLTRGLSAIIHEKTEGSKSKSCVHLDLATLYLYLFSHSSCSQIHSFSCSSYVYWSTVFPGLQSCFGRASEG
jgi:hypothetical protein